MKIKNKWGTLVLMALAIFIIVIDTTIMNVSISALVKDLNTTVSGIQSAISIYGLVMAAFILAGAKMADIIGKKKAFVIGLILFGIGTGTASFANSLPVLIIGWSIIEGLGSALMMPNTQTILRSSYKGKDLAFAYGIIGAMGAIAAALGPIVGGFLTTYYSWRWAFRGELAIVIFTLLFIGTIKSDVLSKIKPKFDYLGTALSVFGFGSVVMGILLAQAYGWFWAKQPFMIGDLAIAPFGLSITPVLLAIGALLIMVLFSWEGHLEDAGTPGLFKPSLFNVRALKIGLNVRFVQMMFMAGFLFVFPLFLQLTYGLDAMKTGMVLVPNSIAILMMAVFGSRLASKFSAKRIIQVGLILSIIGLGWLASIVSMSETTDWLILGSIILGFGMGLIASQIVNFELSSVKPKDVAQASGLDGVAQQLGNSIGVALVGSIMIAALVAGAIPAIEANTTLSSQQKDDLISKVENSTTLVADSQVYEGLIEYGLSEDLANEITHEYRLTRSHAFSAGMSFLAFLGLLGLVMTIRMPNKKLA